MKTAFFLSPCGPLEIRYESGAVVYLKRVETSADDESPADELGRQVCRELDEYFSGKRTEFSFLMNPHGTPFQQKVWAALRTIPYGETRTYKEIAAAVGNDKAARAVGMANNRNPISIAIPCHRVIGASGKLVGYASGLKMKQHLLQLEQTNT